MPVATDTQFATISNREYWTTADGRKLYASEFEDEHLKNTINLLHRKAKSYRLEQAKLECNLVYRTGNLSLPPNEYYRHFKREMDRFMDSDVEDKDWLKQHSKIYSLLVEEAEFRGLEIPTETTIKKRFTIRHSGSSDISNFHGHRVNTSYSSPW